MRKLATQETSFRSAAVMATLRTAHLSCADSEPDASERSKAEFDGLGASQVLGPLQAREQHPDCRRRAAPTRQPWQRLRFPLSMRLASRTAAAPVTRRAPAFACLRPCLEATAPLRMAALYCAFADRPKHKPASHTPPGPTGPPLPMQVPAPGTRAGLLRLLDLATLGGGHAALCSEGFRNPPLLIYRAGDHHNRVDPRNPRLRGVAMSERLRLPPSGLGSSLCLLQGYLVRL